MTDKFSKVCAAVILLLLLLSGLFALNASAEEYVPTQDAVTNAKLDNMQATLDLIAEELAPAEETEQTPAPDYSETLQKISDQLADLQQAAQMATAETAEPDPLEKPFDEYDTKETLLLIGLFLFAVLFVFSLFQTFV